MTHTKKQESMVHTKEKNLSIETDSEWAQTLILADKGFKATVLGVFLFCFVWKKEMEILIWANLKIITQETIFQKALKGAPLKQLFSVQFSRSVISNYLRPHESQHARPSCPSPTPGIHPNSCASSRWCHPAISSSVVPFSSCPQSLLASESFPMSQLFTWGGQTTGVSASASVLPMNTQDWSPLGWIVWLS